MKELKDYWQKELEGLIQALTRERELDTENISNIVLEIPPKPELGDFAFPLFPYAKLFKEPPAKTAAALAEKINQDAKLSGQVRAETKGPYLNLFLKKGVVIAQVLEKVKLEKTSYGLNNSLAGKKIMIEFSCPNTNKPLHLGHLRNNALGEAVARMLSACGAEVEKVNLINDRGIHICKSMLAYQKFGNGETPESSGKKPDHFVGDFYVRYSQWEKEDKSALEKAREILRAWEKGDEDIVSLWKTMNKWAIDGIYETYNRTGIKFDRLYLESETYKKGRAAVLDGLEKGLFYKEEDNSIWIDLSDINLDKKVLLRGDGTSLYLTQDIGTAIDRHQDWPFDQMIYVVASEQNYHFKVLFHVLSVLGHDWARQLYHLAYGMVNLPEGKMKSREGTVVDADTLLDELRDMVVQEIQEKEREEEVADLEATAEKIALGALHYYLLQASPNKDMIFNPKESLSFNGNTGPYLQYTCARISSMLRKYSARSGEFKGAKNDPALLSEDAEWQLIKMIGGLPEAISEAAQNHNPAFLCAYAYELAKTFSRYYHEHPVLNHENKDIAMTRLHLVQAVQQSLKSAMQLLNIPVLEAM